MKKGYAVPIDWSDEVDMRRVVIHCMGDIGVEWFFDVTDPDFVDPEHGQIGWVRIFEGPQGEIGRKTPCEPVELSTCEGVIFGANDPASFDVLANAFAQIAQAMRTEKSDAGCDLRHVQQKGEEGP